MDPWLAVGVVVLIVIAFWLVARAPHSTDTQEPKQEVPAMSAEVDPTSGNGEDRLEWQRARAQAGGEPEQARAAAEAGADAAKRVATAALGADDQPWTQQVSGSMRAFAPAAFSGQRPLPAVGTGIAAFVAAAGGVATGIWFVTRQRARNRPVDRLRRQARGLVQTASSQVPDVDVPAPAGGAGAALALVGSVLLARVLLGRRGSDSDMDTDAGPGGGARAAAAARAAELSQSALGSARAGWRRVPMTGLAERGSALADAARDTARDRAPRSAAPVGIGLGGAAALAAVGYLVWRWLTRDQSQPPSWQIDTSR
jgi:hypothetical protein